MIKKNNLRKVYLVYWIVIGEVFCIAFVLSAIYIAQQALRTIIEIAGYAGIVLIPVLTFLFYRWIRKDNASVSDEFEQMVLTKAFAVTGFVSLSLLPFLLLFCSIFFEAAGYIAFGFLFIIGATFKCSTIYIYKKY